MSSEPSTGPGAFTRLRNYFLTGFVIIAPLAITAWLIWTFVQWVDSWIIPYIPDVYNPETYLPVDIPGVGLIIAIFLITTIGFLTANIIGRSIVHFGERMLGRMPLVRNLYNGLKQIFETVLSDQTSSFQKVGLIEYPRPGLWAIVFIATETKGEVAKRLHEGGVDTLSVFLPTTPNPTSGFLLFVPRNDIQILEMSVEDGAKLVISAGLVTPGSKGKVKLDGKTIANPAADIEKIK
ncbi:MAG: DUF502 domain-containing protein [Rhizobiaceae bacterium]